MRGHDSQTKLRALPTQIIEVSDGVILKRGATAFHVGGRNAAEIITHIFTMAGSAAVSLEAIVEAFAVPHRPIISELIEELRQRRILVETAGDIAQAPVEESSLDVFYWHFDLDTHQVAERLNSRYITVVGVNHISQRLITSLHSSGVTDLDVVDDPVLRNPAFFTNSGEIAGWDETLSPPLAMGTWEAAASRRAPDCLVATSDFGNQHLLRAWNRLCVERNLHFMPVLLQDLIGYVGPLVVPGRTACLECVRSRQNSNRDDLGASRIIETSSPPREAVNGYHPIMTSVLGDVAAFELHKFYTKVPRWHVGTLIEVNLLTCTMTPNKVLKIPRCQVCSTLKKRSLTTLKKSLFLLE
jgi:bacteriocin biosynthesis cyclodehydratase domain-containing protein